MIDFLYANKIRVTEDEASGLYGAADYYDIPSLKDFIADTIPNWRDQNMIVKLCSKIAKLEPNDIETHRNFQLCQGPILEKFGKLDLSSLPCEAMEYFLKSDGIVATEVEIFEVLQKWIEFQSNDISKEKLKSYAYHIRYGTLSQRELTMVVSTSQYYPRDEFSLALQQHESFSIDVLMANKRLFQPRSTQKRIVNYGHPESSTFAIVIHENAIRDSSEQALQIPTQKLPVKVFLQNALVVKKDNQLLVDNSQLFIGEKGGKFILKLFNGHSMYRKFNYSIEIEAKYPIIIFFAK